MKYTPKELHENVNISSSSPVREFFILLGSLLGTCALVYVILGLAVDLVVPRLPAELEQSLGKVFLNSYGRLEKTPSEIELQKLLDSLSNKMSANKTGYTVHIIPRSNDVVNAAALPGGNIIVFSPLIKQAESENELAFVLGHELGHYANRDHLRGLGRSLVLFAVSTVLFGQNSGLSNFLVESLVKVEMKFSQAQEQAADLWALDLLNKRYGHVAGAKDFLAKMAAKEKMGRLTYYFASHPYPQDRLDILEKQIKTKGYLEKEKILLNKRVFLN